jgi:hypothetical protein
MALKTWATSRPAGGGVERYTHRSEPGLAPTETYDRRDQILEVAAEPPQLADADDVAGLTNSKHFQSSARPGVIADELLLEDAGTPAAVRAASCRLKFWSLVDTRARRLAYRRR